MAAVAVFAATRAFIFFGFGQFVTDVPIYHGAAMMGVRDGFSAYCDFWFPYPPFSLPLIYLPAFFSQSYDGYRQAFQLEMMAIDVATFFLLFRFLKDRLRVSHGLCAVTLSLYSLFGLSAPHLIFDRLDIAMSGLFLGAAYFYTSTGRTRWLSYVFLLAGALVKLLPIFFIPLFCILDWHRADDDAWPNPSRAWTAVLCVAIPFAAVIVGYNAFVCDQLISHLSQHGVRGIQIESNWAMPLIVDKIINGSPTDVDYSYGAFHILAPGVPKLYLWLSKNVGFGLLIFYYGALLRLFRKNIVQTEKLKPYTVTMLLYGVILILMTTQRVLSPQYLIWMWPFAAIQFAVAVDRRAVVAGSVAIFGLTYLVFDVGFFEIIHFNPYFSPVLIARNILLSLWAADTLRRGVRAIRENRRARLSEAIS